MKITIKTKVGWHPGVQAGRDKWLFDTDTMSGSERENLEYWCRAYPDSVVSRVQSKPAPTPVQTPAPVIDTRPDVIERPVPEFVDPIAEDFKRDLQRQIDLSQGTERLNFYHQSGLTDSQNNADAILGWLDKNARGYISASGVDAAVAVLRSQLQWESPKPVTPVAPVAPEPIDEVLQTLSNGEKQLSITRPIPSNASAAQAKDYLARFRESNNLKFNSFGH